MVIVYIFATIVIMTNEKDVKILVQLTPLIKEKIKEIEDALGLSKSDILRMGVITFYKSLCLDKKD